MIRKSYYTFFIVLCQVVLVVGATRVVAGEIELAEDGTAKCVVIIGKDAPWIERHAAKEFVKYVKEISGAGIPILTTEAAVGKDALRVLIGTYKNNALIRQFRDKGILTLPINSPGKEEFLGVARIDSNTLVLTGSSRRAVLWAVYDFLETECGVGFFFEGDYVPKHPTLRVDVRTRKASSRFPYTGSNEVSSGTNMHYSNWWRSAEDWDHLVDYCAKKKFKCFFVPYGLIPPQEAVLLKNAIKARSQRPPKDRMRAKRIVDRARKLEFDFIPSLSTVFRAPEEFRRKYPDHRYVKFTWIDKPPQYVLHPDDPLFAEMAEQTFRMLKEQFGSLGLVIYSPFAEQVIHGLNKAEQRQLLIRNSVEVAKALKKIDPKAAFGINSWTFHDRTKWDRETLGAYFAAFPKDVRVVVLDFASSVKDFYKTTDGFWGKEWIFGVYATDGPLNKLQGDMAWLGEEIYDLSRKAHNRLRGVVQTSETNDTNNIFREYAAQLSWNPSLGVYEFIDNYARTRYGERSAKNMARFWKHVAKGSLGPMGRPQDKRTFWSSMPQYTLRPDQQNFEIRRVGAPNIEYHYAQRAQLCVVNDLKALRIGLGEADLQQGNYFYQRDMVEVTRDLLQELYNQHFFYAEKAFLAGDVAAFKTHSKACVELMDMLTNLLRSVFNWPDFSFAARWKAAEKGYRMRTKKEALHWMTGIAYKDGKPYIKDRYFYWRSSFYEAVRDMYRPWVRVYFKYLEKQMDDGVRTLPSSKTKGTPVDLQTFGWFNSDEQGTGTLSEVFRKIALDFALKPLETGDVGKLRSGDPIPAIKQIISNIDKDHLADVPGSR